MARRPRVAARLALAAAAAVATTLQLVRPAAAQLRPHGAAMSVVILDDTIVSALGARCMDGSPAGYYWREGVGADATKYVVFIQGGGECRTAEECVSWHDGHASNSSEWSPTQLTEGDGEMDTDCARNPDFCTWSKVYIPYCTGDMHSGTQTERNPALGNYYFSGHNGIAGVTADLKGKARAAGKEPTHFLISGSSAGGIGALMHTDFFAEVWPEAVVKGAPQCGFFYPGVTAINDLAAGRASPPVCPPWYLACPCAESRCTKSRHVLAGSTPIAHLGFISGWRPYLPTGCKVATNGDVARCTDAHFLYPFLRQPLFIRENQYGKCSPETQAFHFTEGNTAWITSRRRARVMRSID